MRQFLYLFIPQRGIAQYDCILRAGHSFIAVILAQTGDPHACRTRGAQHLFFTRVLSSTA